MNHRSNWKQAQRDETPESAADRRRESRSLRRLELDEANRKLFAIEMRMHRAFAEDRGETESRVAIDELIEYAEKHFAREEELMKAFGYPGCAEHCALHVRLVNDIRLSKSQFIARSLSGAPVAAFLIEQIIGHLKTIRPDHAMVRAQAVREFEERRLSRRMAG
jgi:hemerythrin